MAKGELIEAVGRGRDRRTQRRRPSGRRDAEPDAGAGADLRRGAGGRRPRRRRRSSTARGGPRSRCTSASFSGDVQLQFVGEHYVSNALAAATVACARRHARPEQIADGLNAATRVSAARMEVTERAGRRDGDQRRLQRQPGLDPRRTEGAGRDRPGARGADLGGARRDARARRHRRPTSTTRSGRLVVRLDVNRLVVVGAGAKPIHLGASLEGSWGNESAYVDTIPEALELLRVRAAARVTSYW